MSVPSDIEFYLASDEKVIETGKSQEWEEIYATDRRVLLKKGVFGKEIVEASYRHISSIEYKKGIPLTYIATGIVLIVSAFILPIVLGEYLQDIPSGTRFGLACVVGGMGGGVIIASFLIEPKFKIYVVGREPLTISGKVEEIIKIICQYREKVEAEITKTETELTKQDSREHRLEM